MLQSAASQHHSMIAAANATHGGSYTNYGGLMHPNQMNSIAFKRQLAQAKGYTSGIGSNGRTHLACKDYRELNRPKHVLACSSSSDSDSEASVLSQQDVTYTTGADGGGVLAAETTTIVVEMQQEVVEDDVSIKGGGATVDAAENDEDVEEQKEALSAREDATEVIDTATATANEDA